ncbi:hypothetical protein [Tardiphaga alba]|uniref:hypothetical protein n=1 Tax=Tardiphaga alba TaxID=340268 RepID=UPI0038B5112D
MIDERLVRANLLLVIRERSAKKVRENGVNVIVVACKRDSTFPAVRISQRRQITLGNLHKDKVECANGLSDIGKSQVSDKDRMLPKVALTHKRSIGNVPSVAFALGDCDHETGPACFGCYATAGWLG